MLSLHEYDDPRLTPYTFLLAVMHDRSTPLPRRIEAAAKLLSLSTPAQFDEPVSHEPIVVIRLTSFTAEEDTSQPPVLVLQ